MSTILIIITIFVSTATFGVAYLLLKQSDRQYRLLSRRIHDSVQTKFLELTPTTSSLVELAIEVWRIEKRLAKAESSLNEDQNKAFGNSIAKLHRYLDKNDITIADYTDQKYNEGLNLDILSIEKDSSITESIIKETHEPAVMHKGQLIKKAKVVVLEKQ